MSDEQHPKRGIIHFRTAMILYAVLLAGCMFVTHASARIVIALVILLLAIKTWVIYQRDRLE